MYYIVALIFGLVFGFLYFLYYYFHQRYYSFVSKHSYALKELNKINEEYNFKKLDDVCYQHTYDNEKMYSNLSCYDYLVYQLSYYNNRKELFDKINEANDLRQSSKIYLKEVNQLRRGEFDCEIGNLNFEKLINVEEKVLNENVKKDIGVFHIYVKLELTNMAGRLLARKNNSFSEYDVYHITDLLKEKDGNFYLNRDIWDSICRVERARVSNRMRFSIYERDHYTCRMCHRRFSSDQLEIDHIYPIAKGGKSTYDNLQTLCIRCNKAKGDRII